MQFFGSLYSFQIEDDLQKSAFYAFSVVDFVFPTQIMWRYLRAFNFVVLIKKTACEKKITNFERK